MAIRNQPSTISHQQFGVSDPGRRPLHRQFGRVAPLHLAVLSNSSADQAQALRQQLLSWRRPNPAPIPCEKPAQERVLPASNGRERQAVELPATQRLGEAVLSVTLPADQDPSSTREQQFALLTYAALQVKAQQLAGGSHHTVDDINPANAPAEPVSIELQVADITPSADSAQTIMSAHPEDDWTRLIVPLW